MNQAAPKIPPCTKDVLNNIYGLMAVEAAQVQKPGAPIGRATVRLDKAYEEMEVWEQGSLSVVPNIIAWLQVMVNSSNWDGKVEQRFYVNFPAYPRVLSVRADTGAPYDPMSAASGSFKSVCVSMPDARKMPQVGYAPCVPFTADMFSRVYSNQVLDLKTAATVEQGAKRHGVDIVLINLLYNNDFPDMLRQHHARNARIVTLDEFKDAYFILLTVQGMKRRDSVGYLLDNYRAIEWPAYELSAELQPAGQSQVGLPRVAGSKTPPPQPAVAGSRSQATLAAIGSVAGITESQVLRRVPIRYDIAFDVADHIYHYLMECHKQHPQSLAEYERLRQLEAEEKKEAPPAEQAAAPPPAEQVAPPPPPPPPPPQSQAAPEPLKISGTRVIQQRKIFEP
jgi:hypothetical protein